MHPGRSIRGVLHPHTLGSRLFPSPHPSPNDSPLAPCTHLRKSKSMVELLWMRAQSAQRK